MDKKNQKNYREQESEKIHGKISYRKRKLAEEEAEKELEKLLKEQHHRTQEV